MNQTLITWNHMNTEWIKHGAVEYGVNNSTESLKMKSDGNLLDIERSKLESLEYEMNHSRVTKKKILKIEWILHDFLDIEKIKSEFLEYKVNKT